MRWSTANVRIVHVRLPNCTVLPSTTKDFHYVCGALHGSLLDAVDVHLAIRALSQLETELLAADVERVRPARQLERRDEVVYLFLVDFNVRAFYGGAGIVAAARALSPKLFEDCVHGSRDDTRGGGCVLVVAADGLWVVACANAVIREISAQHRVRLSRSCLSIGEDCAVDSVHDVVDGGTYKVVHLTLRRLLSVACIKGRFQRIFVACFAVGAPAEHAHASHRLFERADNLFVEHLARQERADAHGDSYRF